MERNKQEQASYLEHMAKLDNAWEDFKKLAHDALAGLSGDRIELVKLGFKAGYNQAELDGSEKDSLVKAAMRILG